jgi:hypothetical protein
LEGKKGEDCTPEEHYPSIILWGWFAAGETGALHKIDGMIMRENCGHIEATSQDISQAWFQMGLLNGQ